jgi:pSer/pThr/pTyr-binding forkhead associated (FHA) protein
MDNTVISEEKGKLKSKGRIASKGVLLVLSDNHFGRTFIIDQPVVTIGREEESDFVIDDKMISRVHCSISVNEENHFFIEDLDSANSSFINSKKLKKRKSLYYGDKINIGDSILRFFREEVNS